MGKKFEPVGGRRDGDDAAVHFKEPWARLDGNADGGFVGKGGRGSIGPSKPEAGGVDGLGAVAELSGEICPQKAVPFKETRPTRPPQTRK